LRRVNGTTRGLACDKINAGGCRVPFLVHLEDGGVMNEAVDDSDRHCLVAEHGAMPQ
jgi:hypothetical protein